MITQEAQKRRTFILKRVEDMKLAKKVYSDMWPQWEKSWKLIEEGRRGEDEWKADLPDTWGFATVKTAQSAFMGSKVVPIIIRHEDDPQSKSDDLRDLYVSIADKGNLDQELYYARLDAFKLGNGFTKTVYIKDSRKVWDIKKFNPKTGEFKWEEKEIDDFNDPKTIRVSPYLVLKDDLARADWNTCRDFCELEVMGRSTAERLYPDADWDEIPQAMALLQELKAGSITKIATSDTKGTLTDVTKPANYHFFAPGFEWNKEVVEALNYWNKEEDTYEILLNGFPYKVKTKKDPRPIPYIHKQIPFTHYMFSPYGGDEGWASGIFEIGRHETNAIRVHRESMTNRQKLSLFSPAFTDVNDEIDQRMVKLGPLSLVRTKGGVPHQWQIPGLTNSDLALVKNYEDSYKRTLGIDERLLGVQADARKITATEASYLRESALKRLGEFSGLYKNALLHSEMRLKYSLFKQYFSSPFASEPKTKQDKATRAIKNEFKKFKVKINNVYRQKEVSPNFFEGETDMDLDLQILMPMSQAQQVSVWSQLLRDAVPFVQAKVVDVSLKKIFEKYVEALGSNVNSLKEDKVQDSTDRAETEHALFADKNTSSQLKEIMPQGTPLELLTPEHIKKHNELLKNDIHIEDEEKLNLIDHIDLDLKNIALLQQPNPSALTPNAVAGVGGVAPEAGIPETAERPPEIPTETETPTI